MRKGRLLSILLALVLALTMGGLNVAASASGASLAKDEDFLSGLEEFGISFYQDGDGGYVLEDSAGTVVTLEEFLSGSIGIQEDGTFLDLSGYTQQEDGSYAKEDGDEGGGGSNKEGKAGKAAKTEDAAPAEPEEPTAPEEPAEPAEAAPQETTWDSWEEFALHVNELAAEAKGELVIRNENVGAYQAGAYDWGAEDVPLGIPDGVRLVFENCKFDGMVLSHGDITLRNTTVAPETAYVAVTVLEEPDYPRKTTLRLTIEADSGIIAGSGAAIAADSYYRQPSNITIINHGTIQSDWMAIDANRYGHWGRNTNTAFALYNHGTIRGITSLQLSPAGGTMSAYVENSGLMESDSTPLEMSLTGTRQTGKATFWNREGGVARSTGSDDTGGVMLYLYDFARTTTDWYTGEKWNPTTTGIHGEIINEGLIEGGSCAVTLSVRADNPSTVLLQGDGEYQATGKDAPVLYILATQWEEAKDEIKLMQTPEELQKLLKGWMEGLGFYYMPKEATGTVWYAGIRRGSDSDDPDAEFEYDISAEARALEPMDWAVLVKQAEAAMAADQRDICFYTQRQVLAPEAKDKALSVPEGQRLTLRGGRYDGMRLGGGDFILSNVTVQAGGETPAALAVDGVGRTALRMMIEEGTSILHEGKDGIALDIGGTFGKDVVLDIENHGVIESAGQAARLAVAGTSDGGVTLHLANYGSVTGETAGLEVNLTTTKGAMEADISNHAAIGTAEGHALAFRGAGASGTMRAHIFNRENAEITSEGAEAVLFSLTGAAKEGVAQGEGGLLYNEGTIRGKVIPLLLSASATRPVRIRVRDEASLEPEGNPALVVFVQEQKKSTDEPMPEEAFAPMRDLWLAKMGLAYLPKDAAVDSLLLTQGVEKGEAFEAAWYAQEDHGGGEEFPELATEAANFGAPLFLHTAGDGTIEAAELRLDTYPLLALTGFELREDGEELWFDIHGEMVQYKEWAKQLKASGQDIVTRGEALYSVRGMLAAAYGEMLGRQKQAPVDGTYLKGREVFISIDKLNEGLQLMYPGEAFVLTGDEEAGYQLGIDGQTFWTQAKAKPPAPYLAGAAAEEGDIPFPAITIAYEQEYLSLADAMTLYTLYVGSR